ncbi:hypothetical protein JL722_3389 [Aureococcus anophagefferens]|nr:hypothetical protein JL722_3389 [Aureococcus anophagefferens]
MADFLPAEGAEYYMRFTASNDCDDDLLFGFAGGGGWLTVTIAAGSADAVYEVAGDCLYGNAAGDVRYEVRESNTMRGTCDVAFSDVIFYAGRCTPTVKPSARPSAPPTACAPDGRAVADVPPDAAATPRPTVRCGAVAFAERVITDGAIGAIFAVAVDLDGDGDVDVLAASRDDDTVAWHENDGAQSFAERVISDSADHTYAVFAIDVDGDGDVDALSAIYNDDTVAWYENDGKASLAARVVTASADGVRAVFAIDVDGDGDVDVLSASYSDDTIAWHENDGSQSFTQRIIADSADQASSVFAIDVDGDGDVDVLSGAIADRLAWHESGASDACSLGGTALSGVDCNSLDDVDSYCSASNGVSYWCLDSPNSAGIAAYGSGGSWDCATLELATVAHDDAYDSGATFHAGSTDCGASSGFGERVISDAYDLSYVVAADVDGDGDVDAVAVSFYSDVVAWYENDGSQSFADHVVTAAFDGASMAVAADVDNDGDLDLLATEQYEDDVAWFENDGAQSFAEHSVAKGALDGALRVVASDVDGDGDVDAVAVAINADPDAVADAPATTLCASVAFSERDVLSADGPRYVYVHDVDGDADMDVLSCDADADDVSWWENDGKNSLSFSQRFVGAGDLPTGATYARSVHVADVDSDGALDVVSASTGDDALSWYASAALEDENYISNGGCDGATYVRAVDVDGDGDVDAVATCGVDDTVAWWSNDGAQSFTMRTITTLADYAMAVWAADLDDDGDVDAVSADYSDGAMTYHENEGDATSWGRTQLVTDMTGAHGIHVGDLDGDGDLDVAACSALDDEVRWFENDGAARFTAHAITSSADGGMGAHIADLDQDGDRDILVAAAFGDEVQWWDNDCGTQAPTDSKAPTTSPTVSFAPYPQPTPRPTIHCESVSFSETAATGACYSCREGFPVDLDGDGDFDLVAAEQNGDAYVWYENDGDMSFAERAAYYAGLVLWYENDGSQSFAERVIADDSSVEARKAWPADFDGDGSVDVVATWWDERSSVELYLNDGASSFKASTVASASYGLDVSACDVDGDEDADVVTTSYYTYGAEWHENDGSAASFTAHTITDCDIPRSVTAYDVDGDGDVDAVATCADDEAVVWLDNDGTNEAFAYNEISADLPSGFKCQAGDLDGDGDVDVACTSYSDDLVMCYENDGAQSFTTHTLGEPDYPVMLNFEDMDQDGDLEVIVAAYSDSAIYLYVNDCATFAPTASPAPTAVPSALPPAIEDECGRVDQLAFGDLASHATGDDASSETSVGGCKVELFGDSMVAYELESDLEITAISTLEFCVAAWGDCAARGVALLPYADRCETSAGCYASQRFFSINGGVPTFASSVSFTDYEYDADEGGYQCFEIDLADHLDVGDFYDGVALINDCGEGEAGTTAFAAVVLVEGTRPPTVCPTTSPLPTPQPSISPVPTATPTHAPCAAGYYSNDLEGPGCTACPAGKATNESEATSCDICTVNTYAERKGSPFCLDCPAGRQSGLGSASCSWCMSGQYEILNDAGNKTCVDCGNGTYSPLGLYCLDDLEINTACVACAAGFYSASGQSACDACVAGDTPRAGESICSLASAGSYVNGSGRSAQALCAPGTYSSGAGAATCERCAPGTYQPFEGQTSCAISDAGAYVAESGASAQAACAPGTYSGSGATACAPCAAGTYVSRAGSSAGSSSCSLADAGMVVARAGASAQAPCPAGTISGSAASACTNCSLGFFTRAPGQSSCSLADAGSFVAAEGASRQALCPAGRYSGSGASACSPCLAGYFNPVAGSSTCFVSSAGAYVDAAGAAAMTKCPPGTYSGAGAKACTACAAGSYAAADGSTTCATVTAGSYVSSEGASNETACPAGSYSGSGATACAPCAVGTYVSAEGQTSCTLVSGGSYVGVEGASAQTACPPGSHSGSGATACDACAAATYASANGSTSCALVDAGFYVPAAGASAQTPCDPGRTRRGAARAPSASRALHGVVCPVVLRLSTGGSYVAGTGATSPAACSAGRYSGSGAVFCDLCPSGTTSDDGAATCTTADAGYIAPSAELYRIDLASSMVFAGIRDGRVRGRHARGSLVFWETQLVEDSFSDKVDGARVASVGPAVLVDDDAVRLYFDIVANYSAAAAENISTVVGLINLDFQDKVSLLIYNGAFEAFIQSAGQAHLANASVDEDSSLAAIAETTSDYHLIGNSTFDGQQACPAGTYSLSGASYCVYCDPGSYTDSDGQTSCLFSDAGSYVGVSGATQQWTCTAGRYTAGSGMHACAACGAGTFQAAAGETSCQLANAGSFVGSWGATAEDPCAPGKYSGSGASECGDCDVGFYTGSTGQSACSLADAGFLVNASGASAQTPCATGTFSGSGASECFGCAVGYYAPVTGLSACSLADAGFYVDARGAATQTPCAAGSYSGSGASACSPCAVGYYAATTGLSSCTISDAGFYVDAAGATGMTPCAAGFYSGSGATACAPCAVGTYSANVDGATSCTISDAGFYVDGEGASNETACPAGSYSGSGATACAPCAAARGRARGPDVLHAPSSSGSTSCSLVDAGAYVSRTGASAQTPCDAGHYSGTGASACAACEEGRYAGETAQSSCALGVDADAFNDDDTAQDQLKTALEFLLVDNLFSDLVDAAVVRTVGPAVTLPSSATVFPFELVANYSASTSENISTVKDIILGDFQSDFRDDISGGNLDYAIYLALSAAPPPTSCLFSDAGSYVAGSGSTAQSTCGAGTYTAGSGMHSCSQCGLGTFQAAAGETSCQLANAGSYVGSWGATAEDPCAPGKYSGSGASECGDCDVGFYTGSTGQSACSLADAGFLVNASGASAQTPCATGTFSGSGASECSGCAVGYYAPVTGLSACSLADAGFYVDARGASAQTPCPTGKYSGSGASACSDCAVGYYAATTGLSSCTISDAGFFIDAAGATGMTPCAAGFYSGSGATACTPCAAGSYSANVDGATTCTTAAAGFFVGAPGASAQTPCPAGTYSGSAAVACTPCGVGSYSANRDGATSCNTATAGSFVGAAGATAETACPLGRYSGSAATECAPCAPGTYAAAEGQTSCTLVSGGGYVDVDGPSEQLPCAPGRYSGSGAVACEPCPTTMYAASAGSSSCSLVDAGFYVAATGASSMAACEPGSYSGSGASACTACEQGRYTADGTTSNYGASTCVPSDAGYIAPTAELYEIALASSIVVLDATFDGASPTDEASLRAYFGERLVDDLFSDMIDTAAIETMGPVVELDDATIRLYFTIVANYSAAASENISIVTQLVGQDFKDEISFSAPAGTYSLSGDTACVYCDAGSYTNLPGQTSCLFADAGSYIALSGATAMSVCPAGRYTAGSGMHSCADCAGGTFQPHAGMTSCGLSNAGSYVGSSAAVAETPCAPGRYSGSGAAYCNDCDVGFYTGSTGRAACSLADAGFYVASAGSSSATPCPPGYYSGSGASACTPCGIGTFVEAEGQTSCSFVEAGSYVGDVGASAQTPCPAGTYSGSGATACLPCPAATYAASRGSTLCSLRLGPGGLPRLRGGRFAEDRAMTSCALVSGGTYVATTGAVKPLECAAGRYSGAGASQCALCPEGTASSAGASTCAATDAGTVAAEEVTYAVTVDSSIELANTTAADFNNDTAANDDLKKVLEAAYVDEHNYSASSEENISTAEELIRGNLVDAMTETLESGRLAKLFSRFANRTLAGKLDEGGSLGRVHHARGSSKHMRGKAGAGALACPAGTYSGSGASSCVPCGLGTYTSEGGQVSCSFADPGYYVPTTGATEPSACPAGSYSGSRAAACDPCAENTYTNHSGSSACYVCPSPLTSLGEGNTYCGACTPGNYWDTPYWETTGHATLQASWAPGAVEAYLAAQCFDCCVECPDEGSKCYESGITLENLSLKKDYWRATVYSDELYLCSLTSACGGGAGNLSAAAPTETRYCKRGHEGVLCGVCMDDYMFDTAFDSVENRCIECADPPWDISVSPGKLVSIGLFVIIVVAVAVWWVRRHGDCSMRKMSEYADVVNAARKGKAGEALVALGEKEKEDDDGSSMLTKYLTKIKILMGLYQIIGSTQWSLPQVPFPAFLAAPFSISSFFNLNILSALPLDCFRRVTFFESLVFQTTSPMVLGAAVYVVWTARELRAAGDADARHKIFASKHYLLLLLSFCVLPGAAATTLQYFGCSRYDLGEFEEDAGGGWRRQSEAGRDKRATFPTSEALWTLNADPTIRCYEKRYGSWGLFVGLMIVVYPVGIPLFYFIILWSLRHLLNPTEDDLTKEELKDNGLERSLDSSDSSGAPPAPRSGRGRAGGGGGRRRRPRPPRRRAPMGPDGDEDTGTRLPSRRSRRGTQGRRESFVVKQQRNSMILQAQEQMRLAEVQAALLEHRDKTSGEAVAHVSFLVEEYEPRCYLFSVFECVRRIALTGGLTIFSDGGALQIAMGLLIAMLSHRVYSAYEPYIEDDDDTLSEVAQTQLVFIFFGSLLLYIEANTDGERGYANDLFGGVLMMVMSAGLLTAFYYVLIDALGRERLEAQQNKIRQRAASAAGGARDRLQRVASSSRNVVKRVGSRLPGLKRRKSSERKMDEVVAASGAVAKFKFGAAKRKERQEEHEAAAPAPVPAVTVMFDEDDDDDDGALAAAPDDDVAPPFEPDDDRFLAAEDADAVDDKAGFHPATTTSSSTRRRTRRTWRSPSTTARRRRAPTAARRRRAPTAARRRRADGRGASPSPPPPSTSRSPQRKLHGPAWAANLNPPSLPEDVFADARAEHADHPDINPALLTLDLDSVEYAPPPPNPAAAVLAGEDDHDDEDLSQFHDTSTSSHI